MAHTLNLLRPIIMPSIYTRPVFTVLSFFFRPLVNRLVSQHLSIVIWSFAGYAVHNVGLFRTIRILFTFRRYFSGLITLPYLRQYIYNVNPILGIIFNNLFGNTLLHRGISSILGMRRFINLIIFSSFLLIVKSILLFFSKIALLILGGLLTIFWVDLFKSFRLLIRLAFKIKDFIENYIPISIPTPNNLHRPSDVPSKLYDFVDDSALLLDTYYNKSKLRWMETLNKIKPKNDDIPNVNTISDTDLYPLLENVVNNVEYFIDITKLLNILFDQFNLFL
uniref:Uncharacterized protein n=1 Tax=Coniferiporia sulphurascens TaxID=175648 RepID=A0A5B9RK85_CONSH|nr:hypothetical protein PSUO_000061 [Coniferiporia sulphurascens]QEG57155.1 hypothetical protein PSUO_000061 [Coniferiporia sulphurascens]